MRLQINQFHGARPRRDPRLLGPYEAQVAENCRLYSGALGSWRKPTTVLAVGTNSLRYSNTFGDAAWTKTGVTVTANNQTAPDDSTTMDTLVEDATNGSHGVFQSLAKGAAAERWTGAISFKALFRTYAVVELSDGGSNKAWAVVNLTSGAIAAQGAGGTFSIVSVAVDAEANSAKRLTLIVNTGTESVIAMRAGGALFDGSYAYSGSNSTSALGVYGASLRKAGKKGAYRETLATAAPDIESIYLYKGQYWLVSPNVTNITKGPIPGDSTDALYFTGDGAALPSVTYDPLVYAGGTGRGDMPRQFYTIGLPSPDLIPVPTLQPASGNITAATSLVASVGTQTTATFSVTGAATNGLTVIAQSNFNVLLTTSDAQNITVNFTIKRGSRVIAEAERKISLNFAGAISETEEVEVLVQGEDTPPAGTHTYDFAVTITVGSGSITSTTHSHSLNKVRYKTTEVTITGTNPFVPGNFVTIAGVVGMESLNQTGIKVVSAAANKIRVDIDTDEIYTSGGTWEKDFQEGDKQDTAWVLTFFTQVGDQVQEGPPSNASDIIPVGPGQPVLLSNLATAPPSDGGIYNVTGKRLYRTNVATDGSAAFQFVADVPLANTSYTDSTLSDALGEVLPSTEWVKPPAGLQGLIALPNGSMAGYVKNELCFCEPFQAHAWPTKYRIPVNFQPNGLAAFGSSVLVCTAGKPALVVGSEPGNQRLEYVEASNPCMSGKSIVDMGDFVVYAADDGLVMVSMGNIRTITRELFKKEEWEKLNPASMLAASYGGRYICFFTRVDGARGGFVFDPQEPTSSYVELDFGADVAWTDPTTGHLYLVIDETIVKWNEDVVERYDFRWRSRRYTVGTASNFAYGKIIAEAYPVRMALYANIDPDDDEAFTEVFYDEISSGEVFSLPADYLATSFEVEFSGHHTIKNVVLGSSISALKEPQA